MSEWQPIETAPRDGTPIDIWIPGYGRVAGAIRADAYNGVTHWMKMPEPPPAARKGGEQ